MRLAVHRRQTTPPSDVVPLRGAVEPSLPSGDGRRREFGHPAAATHRRSTTRPRRRRPTRLADGRGRRRPTSAALPEPRAVLARLQRPGAGARPTTRGAAARAGQVLRHLQPEPRRVLPGPGGRPHGPGGRRASAAPRPTAARPASSSTRSPTRVGELVDRLEQRVPRRGRARRWPRSASCSPAGTSSTTTTASTWSRSSSTGSSRCSRRSPSIPGHPFPYISNLSLNLAVVAPRPGHRRAPLRPGEGAAAAAPVRGHARRRALRAARAGHRRPPRPAVPGHGRRGDHRLPGHPQRRPHARGGGGRRPARRGRDGAAPPPLRPGRAPRDRRAASPTRSASCWCASSTSTEDAVYEQRRPARPRRPVGAARRSTGPT